jgi:hypothetical protein
MAVNKKTVLVKDELERYIKRDYLDRSFRKSGLCAYCERRQSCSLCGDFGLIYDCEDYLASSEASCGLSFTRLEQVEAPEEHYGLCAECQNRDFCSLKNINGGVWHCDEYI